MAKSSSTDVKKQQRCYEKVLLFVNVTWNLFEFNNRKFFASTLSLYHLKDVKDVWYTVLI
ncbi:hypothetical protein T4C_9547 [Trichinella pseudospiralis]|uniref:Uncharacterized protein n=1 Tax=Trichinella pseudospiralis TaxID=6337 RepID=A0A0V1J323_TRIPS|nr:hypothetical protein T4C_9547 [Trichinella pseudospiralis]